MHSQCYRIWKSEDDALRRDLVREANRIASCRILVKPNTEEERAECVKEPQITVRPRRWQGPPTCMCCAHTQ
jgi:hypothetical protein